MDDTLSVVDGDAIDEREPASGGGGLDLHELAATLINLRHNAQGC